MNQTAVDAQMDLEGLPIFNDNTLQDYLNHWATHAPDKVWLIDRTGDQFQKWSWSEAQAEIMFRIHDQTYRPNLPRFTH